MTHLYTAKNEDLGLKCSVIRDHRGVVALARDTDANEMVCVRIWGPNFTDHDAETKAVDFAHNFVD